MVLVMQHMQYSSQILFEALNVCTVCFVHDKKEHY